MQRESMMTKADAFNKMSWQPALAAAVALVAWNGTYISDSDPTMAMFTAPVFVAPFILAFFFCDEQKVTIESPIKDWLAPLFICFFFGILFAGAVTLLALGLPLAGVSLILDVRPPDWFNAAPALFLIGLVPAAIMLIPACMAYRRMPN